MGMGRDLVLAEAAELVLHHGEHLVVETGIAEIALGDQFGNARPGRRIVAGRHQGADIRRQEGGDGLAGDAHVGGAQDLALAEQQAAGELAEIFAEGRAQHQPLELTEIAARLQSLRPAEHLAQALDIGRGPGQAVGGVLFRLERLCGDPAIRRDLGRDALPGRGEQRVGGGQRRAAGRQEVDLGGGGIGHGVGHIGAVPD